MSETPCKNCCFAIYEQHDIVPTQVDCELLLLEKFEEKKVDIKEVFDDEKEFFVINSMCPYFRNNNKEIDKVWLYHDSPNRVEQVYKEVKLNYSTILYIDGKTTKSSLAKTLNGLKSLTLKPSSIIIMSNGGKFKPAVLRENIEMLDIPYRIEFSVEPLSRNTCLDIASTKTTATFLMWINAGYILHNTFIDFLNYKIQNLIPFLVYIPKNPTQNTLTIQRQLFDLLGRNTGKSFLEKLVNVEDYKKFTVYEQ